VTTDGTMVRDLLRHRENFSRLRKNPLALQLFPSIGTERLDARVIAQRILSAVTAALDAIAPDRDDASHAAEHLRRLQAIVERCDLGEEPHDVVARELGVCRRQFYRDRREAFERIACIVREQAVAPAFSVAERPDEVALQLTLASRLQNAGHFSAARTALERLSTQTLAPPQRALAMHELIELLCESGNISEARTALTRAKRDLANTDATGDELRLLRAETLAAKAAVMTRSGEAQSAIAAADQGIRLLETAGAPGGRVPVLLMKLAIAKSFAQCETGSFEAAIQTIGSAKHACDFSAQPAIAATLHLYGGFAHVCLPWGIHRAARENGQALQIARAHGLLRYEAVAYSNLCVIHLLRSEYEEALQYGRGALMLCESIGAPLDLSQLLMNLARVETARGNTANAIDLLTRAKRHSVGNPPGRAMIEVAYAEALNAQGAFGDAAPIARHARSVFEDWGVRKQMGMALSAEAEAYAGLGKQRAAVAAIHDAVDAVESVGSAYSLAHVYRVSAKITGNERHAGNAADIRLALRS
jgi:tetratricopeptide (TPR) repeat protein